MRYKDNPEIAKKYNCKRWRDLRKLKLMINPICERCEKHGKINSAFIIHHKDYVNESNFNDDAIFYNIENLESLCFECHNKEHFKSNNYFFDENGDIYESSSNR